MFKSLRVSWNIKRLQNPDAKVRNKAAEALGRLGDTRAFEPLIKALGDQDRGMRCAAAEALGKLGEQGWLEIVHGDSEDWQRLGECDDKRAIEPLIKRLSAEALRERCSVARVLGKIAKIKPEWIRTRWVEVSNAVRKPHDDFSRTSDCHADCGIGLDFPDPPAGDF